MGEEDGVQMGEERRGTVLEQEGTGGSQEVGGSGTWYPSPQPRFVPFSIDGEARTLNGSIELCRADSDSSQKVSHSWQGLWGNSVGAGIEPGPATYKASVYLTVFILQLPLFSLYGFGATLGGYQGPFLALCSGDPWHIGS